jgi:hypothetical protein
VGKEMTIDIGKEIFRLVVVLCLSALVGLYFAINEKVEYLQKHKGKLLTDYVYAFDSVNWDRIMIDKKGYLRIDPEVISREGKTND